ncbi:SPOC domain containing protein, putative [Babesia ovis]|uniref:SPOC domain containing protein, putative n=1 Tax=Babesia ovis TaxID=5869 RepID=A0A9W5TAT2_BABOV|nr:SPOC domain containing protein, putative [Babesia ovis]
MDSLRRDMMADHIAIDYSHVEAGTYRGSVYSPSEDTFLFTEALERDIHSLVKRHIHLVLEIGCGSGYISAYFIKLLQRGIKPSIGGNDGTNFSHLNHQKKHITTHEKQRSLPFVITIDINPSANMATLETLERNGVNKKADTLTADMFTSFNTDRCKNVVDLVLFNPPYVPSDGNEDTLDLLDMAWYGGVMGREVIDRFIDEVGNYLSQDGTVYLLLEKRNDVPGVVSKVEQLGYEVEAPHIFTRKQTISEDSYNSRPLGVKKQTPPIDETGPATDDLYQEDVSNVDPNDVDNEEERRVSPSVSRGTRRSESLNRSASTTEQVQWYGKLSRNGKKIVDAVAVVIQGTLYPVLHSDITFINITHRLKWEDAEKIVPIAIFYFKARSTNDAEDFHDYLTYFQEKQRIGVATLDKDRSIYVAAPGSPMYEKYIKEVPKGPILIAMAVEGGAPSSPAPKESAAADPREPEPEEDRSDWLNQLNSITAMLNNN